MSYLKIPARFLHINPISILSSGKLQMTKKRIILLTSLLAVCIAGQALLRPSFGSETIGSSLRIDQNPKNTDQPIDTNNLLLTDQENPESPNLQSQLIKQLLIMIGFVSLIGLGAWFFCKKLACNWTTNKSKNINVTETISLGPRKLLHIVHVGSKQYLISSTPENINMLTEITESLNESRD